MELKHEKLLHKGRHRVAWIAALLVGLTGCRPTQPDRADNTLPVPDTARFHTVQSAHLTISLDRTFPEKRADGTPLRANFEAVARDVLEVVRHRFSDIEPLDTRPIVCYLSTESVPRTDATLDPAILWIGLALPPDGIANLDYGRFAFQLGHELGHVMLDSRRGNGLIETIADAVSYQALEDLSALWAQKYTGAWKTWAPHFVAYRQEAEQHWLRRFPQEIQQAVAQRRWGEVTAYLKRRRSDLDRDPYTEVGDGGLALRSLGAMALLSQPVDWKDFRGLATLTDPPPQQDGRNRNDLPIDLTHAPIAVQTAVARLR